MAFRDARNCLRKAEQHSEMAGLARQDRDHDDVQRHIRLANWWLDRMAEGGTDQEPQS